MRNLHELLVRARARRGSPRVRLAALPVQAACVADRFDDCMCSRCEPGVDDLFRAAWRLAREQDEIDAATVPIGDAVDAALAAIFGRAA